MSIAERLRPADLEADPYPIYRLLRDEEPWAWSQEMRLWLVTRHEDVVFVDDNPELFRCEIDKNMLSRALGPGVMVRADGANHLRLRQAADSPLRRRTVRPRWQAALEDFADATIDQMIATHGDDLVADFAAPFCGLGLLSVAGVDVAKPDDVIRWSRAFIAGATNYADDPAVWDTARRARDEVHALVADVVDRVRTAGDIESRHSVAASMALAHPEAPVDVEEITSNICLLFTGGFNEPRDVLATLLWHLLRDQRLKERVLIDDASLDAAIEECVRWLTPLGAFPRQVAKDQTFGNAELHAGDLLLAIAGSGNRDERVFEDPDEYLPERDNTHHLGFSVGVHYCQGRYFASEMIRIGARKLLSRMPNLRLDETAEPAFRGWMFRGPSAVQVAYPLTASPAAAKA